MKTIKKSEKLMFYVILSFAIFSSCEKDNKDDDKNDIKSKVAYVVNYGSYSGSKSEISIYNIDSSNISHDGYHNANALEFSSNIQSMAIHNDIAYFMSNNGDKIDIVDAKTLEASVNPIADDITKPRYFAASGNTAYISCWGDVSDWSVMANSYIAKIDLTTKEVTKIDLPGGPEGMIICNNKLFVGSTTKNKVAVIHLITDAISYIDVPAIPQHFVKDYAGNLWVSLVTKYSVPFPSDSLGLSIINPVNNTVTGKVDFASIGDNGYVSISDDRSKVYVMGNEAWPGTASTIYAIDVENETIGSSALISGEQFYGFNVNPENGNIYVLISPSTTESGTLKVYDNSGSLIDEEQTGIAPQNVVFYNIK